MAILKLVKKTGNYAAPPYLTLSRRIFFFLNGRDLRLHGSFGEAPDGK
jgi:hypothetical protein